MTEDRQLDATRSLLLLYKRVELLEERLDKQFPPTPSQVEEREKAFKKYGGYKED